MPDERSPFRSKIRRLTIPVGLALLAAIFAAPSGAESGDSGRASSNSAKSGDGYWVVGSDGGVFTYGDAQFFGSAAGQKLNKPITDIVPTPTKKGYWLVASDGGIFSFGDANFFGSPARIGSKAPIVGMASTGEEATFSKQSVGPEGAQGPAGSRGPQGDPGPQGSAGPQGRAGNDATYAGPHWGVVHRNVIGNASAELGASTQTPPIGDGALNLHTASANDKAAFGNEKDFAGQFVKDLKKVSYSVFTTGENADAAKPATNNMPSIAFEIDPNLQAFASKNFSTLVYAPDNSPPNVWTGINAVTDTGKHWGLTGFPAGTPCDINGPRCTFAEVQAFLNDGGEDATIYTVQITKGRDFAFSGAVDGLVINNSIYDFEPFGVYSHSAP